MQHRKAQGQQLCRYDAQVYSKLTPYEGGNCILTDDKAPVEVLGMRVLDELIGDELNYYKDELRTGGLSALIGN